MPCTKHMVGLAIFAVPGCNDLQLQQGLWEKKKKMKQIDVNHTQEGIGHKPAGQGEG
jgi:hypothetical protein